MWAGAGISTMYRGSKVIIPTSVYSMSLALAERVGGWDTGPEAIGEDMHMFIKCFFKMSGNLEVQPIYAAASQFNVSSEYAGIRGYFGSLGARYQQASRHMWGALDSGFAVRECTRMLTCTWKEAALPLARGRQGFSHGMISSTMADDRLGHIQSIQRQFPEV